jgi:hypothetical protein
VFEGRIGEAPAGKKPKVGALEAAEGTGLDCFLLHLLDGCESRQVQPSRAPSRALDGCFLS